MHDPLSLSDVGVEGSDGVPSQQKSLENTTCARMKKNRRNEKKDSGSSWSECRRYGD
jgi:hypothetical protein